MLELGLHCWFGSSFPIMVGMKTFFHFGSRSYLMACFKQFELILEVDQAIASVSAYYVDAKVRVLLH